MGGQEEAGIAKEIREEEMREDLQEAFNVLVHLNSENVFCN